MSQTTQLACSCGKVRLEVEKAPIISSECHCTSCRSAGARLARLPAAPAFMEPNGGTRYVLYRKDRIKMRQGADRLQEFRLSPEAPTRRVVASCCNTPMFLEFQHGHWLSIYSCLWPEDSRPQPELRTMTSDLPDASVLPDDVPNFKQQSLRFFARLLGAWIAMGFKSPRIDGFINGEIQA